MRRFGFFGSPAGSFPSAGTLLNAFGLSLLLVITFFVYLPGLPGDFVLDDSTNLVNNERLQIENLSRDELVQAAFSGGSGPLKRPISMLSFALNFYFSGPDPFLFKLTNLVIHLLSGISLYVLTLLIASAYRRRSGADFSSTHIRWLGLAVTAAWLLHPLNLTGVLYVVQRMTSLSALFTIWGLIFYVAGRLAMSAGRTASGIIQAVLGLFAFTLLGTFSKENGALLPLLALVIEGTLFRFQTPTRRGRLLLLALFSVTVAVPLLWVTALTLKDPGWITGGYGMRDFTLPERLMTEARALWFYLELIVIPDLAQLGLYHDDIPVSRGLLEPASTLFAILGIVALSIAAIYLRRRAPLAAFGILFFLAGHSLESSVFALELVHEHRNYLPSYGILLVMFYYLMYPLTHTRSLRYRYIVAGILILAFTATTGVRAAHWGRPVEHALAEATNHPMSARANYEIGRIFAIVGERQTDKWDELYPEARRYFEQANAANPGYTNGLFGLVVLSYTAGRPLEEEWLTELKTRLRDKPFQHGNATWFGALVGCQKQGPCRLPDNELVELFDAALANATIASRTRAAVLASATDLYVNYFRDYSSALRYAKEAVAAAPDEPQYRLNLVNILIAGREFQAAHDLLDTLKQADKYGANSRRIAEQEQLLIQAEQAAS